MREVNVVDSLYPAPQNAVTYEIRASTDVLALTAAGVPKSVSISASLYKSDGQNVGLCADFNAFLYVYDAAGNLLKSEQLNEANTITTNISNMNNIFRIIFRWLSGTEEVVSKEIPTVKDGSAGAAGSAGPLIYPAGIFSLDKSYTRTSLTAPYVAHNSLYYYLAKTGTFTGINPADDYAANGVNATWRPYDNFQAAFFEIVMAEFARLGKAVFFNDYMMSQYGVTPSGADTNEYQNFAAGTFIPNILLNFLTGAGHLSAGNFSWDQYGRTYRKSKEIIVWRSIADEFGTLETEHNVNLKKGTYFDFGSWTKAIINLPDPALHQGLELELRGPIATTRVPRDWPTFRSNGFAMMGWSTTTSDYVTCSRVISYITGSARANITSQKVNNVWTWVADSNFIIIS